MFRTSRNLAIILAATVFAAVAAYGQAPKPVPAHEFRASSIASHIDKIAAGNSNAERVAAVRSELAKHDLRVATEGFTANDRAGQTIEGTNIFAEVLVPEPKFTVMLGAHLDRVERGRGAIDNASGSAVVIELARAFRARPMKNVRLIAAFWDREEIGLVGSRTFVESRKDKGLPEVYINFDVFGFGNTLWLRSTDKNSEFVAAISSIAETFKIPFRSSREYPPSDHLSFDVAGVSSYSFSLIDSNEMDAMMKLMRREQLDPKMMPPILQLIHTENDTADKIDAAAVAKVLPAIEAAIRKFEK